MEKVTFEQVGNAAQEMITRGETLWVKMVSFALTALPAAIKAAPDDRKALSEAFQQHEAEYKEKHENANLNAIGAYRSAKSIIGAAAHYKVPLVEKGKVRGKSEVEKAIKDVREKPSAIATVVRSCTTIDGKLDELAGGDWAVAYSTIKTLFDKVTKKAEEVLKAKGKQALDKKAEKLLEQQEEAEAVTK
jgi:hypothetical protein